MCAARLTGVSAPPCPPPPPSPAKYLPRKKNIWSALERPEAAVVGLVGDVLAGAVRGAEGVGGEGAAGVRVPAQAVAGAGPAQPGHIVDIYY